MIVWMLTALYVMSTLYTVYLHICIRRRDTFIRRLVANHSKLFEAANRFLEQNRRWERLCLDLMDGASQQDSARPGNETKEGIGGR